MTDMLTMFNLGRNIIGSNIYNHGWANKSPPPGRKAGHEKLYKLAFYMKKSPQLGHRNKDSNFYFV